MTARKKRRQGVSLPAPSEQEIQDHLDAMNRVSDAWDASISTTVAKKKGIGAYLEWFGDRGIVVYQDEVNRAWRLREP